MDNYKFTTKNLIIDGERTRIVYSLEEDGTLKIYRKLEKGKEFWMDIEPFNPLYPAAKAAFDEKAEKRATYDAQGTREHVTTWIDGAQLKGSGYVISLAKDIGTGTAGRILVTFKRRPSADTIQMVKDAGFYWSPTGKHWSRKLTNKGWMAAQELHQAMSK